MKLNAFHYDSQLAAAPVASYLPWSPELIESGRSGGDEARNEIRELFLRRRES